MIISWHILNTENAILFERKISLKWCALYWEDLCPIFLRIQYVVVYVAFTDRKAIPKSHNLCAYNPHWGQNFSNIRYEINPFLISQRIYSKIAFDIFIYFHYILYILRPIKDYPVRLFQIFVPTFSFHHNNHDNGIKPPIKTFHVIFGVCDSILQLLLHRHLSKYFSFVQGDLHYACYV